MAKRPPGMDGDFRGEMGDSGKTYQKKPAEFEPRKKV